jgi:hypothetical protein
MLKVEIDEKVIERLFLDELKKRLDQIEQRRTFWDTNELKRQTCMSWNTIQDKFFYDPRFPKYKIGGKWMFPAAECEEFLLKWIKEQPTQ